MSRVILCLSMMAGAASVGVAQDAIADALAKSAKYVQSFREELSSVVAEESYRQVVRTAMGVNITVDGKGTQPRGHRDLKSDILMVRLADGYTEFRDVFEVDGSRVRDRQNRLADLFLSSDRGAGDQMVRLNQESARYNIGNVYRNFNTPSVALMFLEPDMQGRFAFRPTRNRTPALATQQDRTPSSRFYVSDRVIVIEYKETQKHTVIRRLDSLGDLPSSGRFWIDPDNGHVMMSELLITDPLMRCTIDVAYATANGVNVLVPTDMRERYVDNRDHVTTEGTATYDKLRRFQVNTNEVIPEIDKPGTRP
jgi:hypothetical protein